MRSTLLTLALAVALLGFAAAPEARAQYVYPYYGYYPSVYYYGPTYYYPPAYSYGYYGMPSNYWYGRYYVGRRSAGWSYGTYNPYTNQYFYWYNRYPYRWWR
jgi:hypothetical protein